MRYLLSDLSPGKTYYFQFRSKAADGSVSDWSRTFSLSTTGDIYPPLTPTGLTLVSSGRSFQAAWTGPTNSTDGSPATDLRHYLVKVESSLAPGVSKTYTTPDTKFEVTFERNLETFTTARGTIGVSVAAQDMTGNISAYTSVVTASNPAPANVTGLTATAGVDQIILGWNPNIDEDLKHYEVWRSKTGAAGTYTKQWTGTTTQWIDPTIDYFTDHWYRVYAVDVFNTPSASAAQTGSAVRPTGSFVIDTTPPAVPTGLAATLTTDANYAKASMAVSWTAVADPSGDLSGYRIGYRPVGASDWQYTDVDAGPGTTTSTIIDRLTALVNYEVRIRSYDFYANYSAWSSTVTTSTAASNSAPSTPTAPTVASSTQNIQVSVPGTKAAGGAMEADVTYYEVYASTTTGFTPGTTNQVGVIPVGPAMIATFQIPTTGTTTTQTWYVKIIAVDSGGLKSSASAQATATPGLILTANIADAQITNAKINDLAANKITAGTGLIADLTVKSTLTLGDASTDGIIKSFDWVSNTTGYRMTKNTLEINGGSIAAAALKLQNGHNMMPPQYADFEYTDAYYTDSFWNPRGQGQIYNTGSAGSITNVGTTRMFGAQALTCGNFNPGSLTFRLAPNNTTYNIPVEPNGVYYLSGYTMNYNPNATSWTMRVIGNNSATIATATYALPGSESAFTRRGFSVTIPGSGVTSVVVEFTNSDTTVTKGIAIDGMQFEPITAGLVQASAWKPPAQTIIDGSGVTTGYLRSTADITVAGTPLPAWSLTKTGSMQVGDALIRGKLIVGTVTEAPVNRAPNNGDFEVDAVGYSVYHAGATGTAIARTTTGGEVISGTGSLKVTAAAGSKTGLGTQFSITNAIAAGYRISVTCKVKADATGGTYAISFLNSSGTSIDFLTQIPTPTANQVYDLSFEYTVPVGQDVKSFILYMGGGTTTATSIIFDEIVVNDDVEVGSSFVSSPDYSRGSEGWRIFGDGSVEFNNGMFRGRLGANMVDAEQLVSEIVMSSKFRTALTGRRVEFDGTGISLYESDESLLVNLPTDTTGPASFNGDLLATSLTVSDQMAIRGTNNELSKGATLTLSSGTTEPTSPPTVQIGYEQVKIDNNPQWAPYRFGLAYSSTLNRFISVQNIYNGNAALGYYNPSTGEQDWTQTTLKHVRTEGSVMVFGGEIYILGKDINSAWQVEVRNETTKAWVRTWPTNNGYAYRAAIGNDGTNVFVIFGANSTHQVWKTTFNKTTGAIIGSSVNSGYTMPNNYHISAAGYIPASTTGGFSAARFWFARDNQKLIQILDSSFAPVAAGSQEEFTSPNNIRGAVFANTGSGNYFYTWDQASGNITKHSEITWTGSAANNSKWWAATTWYDPDATGSTHETKIGKQISFTMLKRAALTITAPPIPVRPLPNTTDDVRQAGIYMAQNSALPTSAMMQRQAYTANESRVLYLNRNGGPAVSLPAANAAAGSPPPTVNGFIGLATAPAEIRSNDDRIQLYGDGTFILGDAKLDTSTFSGGTYVVHNARQYTMTMASGWGVYNGGVGGFGTGCRAYRTADGAWVLTGLFERTGTAVSVGSTGVLVATIPSYSGSAQMLSPSIATSISTARYCLAIQTNGQVNIRTMDATAVSFATGQWGSFSGITFHAAAN